jgi:hypothetical protein
VYSRLKNARYKAVFAECKTERLCFVRERPAILATAVIRTVLGELLYLLTCVRNPKYASSAFGIVLKEDFFYINIS